MAQQIRYFGADVVYGEDCRPLSRNQGITMSDGGGSRSTTVGGMIARADSLKPRVTYRVAS